ncbi:C40 family peptidase [Paenibacillus cymbidii]|uniref:C40 family peptidase n=1 Tax=Paenibacillus cymbidii TaxID=1639034 RepID=UPI00108150B5|nr:NlpC/P60 family protein [Paenibacillus cymbidii]
MLHQKNAAAAASNVLVQVNDELVSFPDAQPFIDSDGISQVPVRIVSEKLGYKVEAAVEGPQVTVTIAKANETVTLLATRDGSAAQQPVKDAVVAASAKAAAPLPQAKFVDGRVFVPIRFVSETFGLNVQWDGDNRIAIIDADGKYHAPAWYAPKTPPLSQLIVQEAKQFLGVRYVWGGESPTGFDCSGLVGYVFGESGIDLPRTSVGMYDTAGKRVTDLQAGDLVFFAKGIVNHVGIYIGDNQFISATTSGGVRVDSLASSYWGPRYVGAKRVL